MLSVNNLNAQIKLIDMWEATHLTNDPTKVTTLSSLENAPNTRFRSDGNLKEIGKSIVMQSTFLNDATKAWNLAPQLIKMSKSVFTAKKNIKQFVKSLPI